MHVVTIVVTLWNADMCVDSVSVQSVSSCKMKLICSVAMFYFASGRNLQRCLHGRLLQLHPVSEVACRRQLSSASRQHVTVPPRYRLSSGGSENSERAEDNYQLRPHLSQMRTTKIYAFYTEKAAFKKNMSQ